MKSSASALERALKWQKENPERRKEIRAKWIANNLEKMRAIRAEWKRKNADKVRAERAQWMRDHPEVRTANEAKRRTRKSCAGGSFTAADIDKLFDLQKGCCAMCRSKLSKKFHRDHIMPVALGGSSDIENIQLLCQPCNGSKGAKHPIDYAQKMGKLL